MWPEGMKRFIYIDPRCQGAGGAGGTLFGGVEWSLLLLLLLVLLVLLLLLLLIPPSGGREREEEGDFMTNGS